MLKTINKVLSDKNDYHLDNKLKDEIEYSDFLLKSSLILQKQIIIKKLKYFLKFDKFFIFKILLKYFLKLTLIIIFLYALLYILLYIFNFNFKISEKEIINNLPVYILSTGDHKKDSLKILYYKENLNKHANYIIFYMKDSTKDFNKFSNNLSLIESGNYKNQYEARRENSQYWGKYQMGELSRKSVKMDNYTWEEFKSNPDLQELAFKMWINVLYKDLEYYIKKYDGTILGGSGWFITESGLIAMAHNVGASETIKFLNSGGKIIPTDGSGKDATRFLILGNYDLNIRKN